MPYATETTVGELPMNFTLETSNMDNCYILHSVGRGDLVNETYTEYEDGEYEMEVLADYNYLFVAVENGEYVAVYGANTLWVNAPATLLFPIS